MTPEEFANEKGRRRARRALLWGDHGFVRALYDNSHEVAPGKLWRSFQPGPATLAKWRDRGIRTVVNLRGPKPSPVLRLEEAACADLGLALVNFRVFSREAPSPEILHGARQLFREIEYPALIHCKSGADRAGLAATLYRFFEAGDPLDVAMEELSLRYGHVRQGKTGVIDYALEKYIAHARGEGIALDDVEAFFAWVDGPYDHVAAKAEFKSNWWGSFLTETLLRRE